MNRLEHAMEFAKHIGKSKKLGKIGGYVYLVGCLCRAAPEGARRAKKLPIRAFEFLHALGRNQELLALDARGVKQEIVEFHDPPLSSLRATRISRIRSTCEAILSFAPSSRTIL